MSAGWTRAPAVGDVLPTLERRMTLTSMVAYAGATWDWHRLHYDPEFVAAMKLPGPVVDGQVFGALLVQMIQDWLGPQCFVQQLHFTFKSLVFADEIVRCSGTVTEAAAEWVVMDLRVDVVAADGEVSRTAAAPAGARVQLGVADGAGTR